MILLQDIMIVILSIPQTMLALEGFLLLLDSNSPAFQDVPVPDRAILKV